MPTYDKLPNYEKVFLNTYQELKSPRSYKELTTDAKTYYCNGCGRAGLENVFVPDSLWLLDVSEACNIHDYEYSLQKNKSTQRKYEIDLRFLGNMFYIIKSRTKFKKHSKFRNWLIKRRRNAAIFYYDMVVLYGADAFWRGKDRVINE